MDRATVGPPPQEAQPEVCQGKPHGAHRGAQGSRDTQVWPQEETQGIVELLAWGTGSGGEACKELPLETARFQRLSPGRTGTRWL